MFHLVLHAYQKLLKYLQKIDLQFPQIDFALYSLRNIYTLITTNFYLIKCRFIIKSCILYSCQIFNVIKIRYARNLFPFISNEYWPRYAVFLSVLSSSMPLNTKCIATPVRKSAPSVSSQTHVFLFSP